MTQAKDHIDSIDDELESSARDCNPEKLAALLDKHPHKLDVRIAPYNWTLLHAAAHSGCVSAVDLLLARGLDPNAKEEGDKTYPMHWAAAAGHAEVVKRLIDAGGDVIGSGDDHELEVIGWATCWEGCDDARHREVVNLLLKNGAKHHIFSAIAMNLGEEVRRIVAGDPSAMNRRLSRNENNQTPLHFAVRFNRPEMVSVLLELGADPLAVDGGGQTIASYAQVKDVDRAVMESIHAITLSEISSAERGQRKIRAEPMDLVASLSLRDWETANRLAADNPALVNSGGAVHIMAKRSDAESLKWLLGHGADPNTLWMHWDAEVTPLHLASFNCSGEIARILLDAGADPTIHDSRHAGDALDWAEHFGCIENVRLLTAKK